MTGENYASIFFQAIAMEGTYCNRLTGVPKHPLFADFEAMPVFLFADERCSQIVVWGIDNVPQGLSDWVDEEVCYDIFPFYCVGNGKDRKSPVYYLMNIADAIKQFFERTKVPKPEVHMVLLTNSEIENYDDVKREWEYFNVHVVMRPTADDFGENLPVVIPPDGKMETVFTALCKYIQSDRVEWLYDRAAKGLLKDHELTGMCNKWKRGRAANSAEHPTKQQIMEAIAVRKYAGLSVFEDDTFMKWCRGEDEPVDDKPAEVQDEEELEPFCSDLSKEEYDDFEERLQKLLFDDTDEAENHDGDSAKDSDGAEKDGDNVENGEDNEKDGEKDDGDGDDEAVYQLDISVPEDLRVDVLNPYQHPDRLFNKMIGMSGLREFISRLSALTVFKKRVSAIYPKKSVIQVSLHSLFVGPVGTGKTSAARLMGSCFREAGVLSSGHLVVCSPQSFTGQNFGSEESNVHELLKLARGGVLFIDEAYQLAAKHPHDPLRKILPMMLNLLGDEAYRDIAVILAGYEEEMDNLLSLNPGLRSRFPNRFVFKSFSLEELQMMAQMRANNDGFTFTDEAWGKLCDLIRKDYDVKDKEWGNGRYITNLLNFTYLNHAQRCIEQDVPDSQLLCITAEDISPLPSTKPAPTRTIGFMAATTLSA